MPKTRVFLSWSEERSRNLALFLRDWLPRVVPTADPWMSEEDIDKGSRSGTKLLETLDDTQIGIVVVTPENIASTYLNFEAGALAKTAKNKQLACPYLLGLKKSQVKGPLTLLQLTEADEKDTRRLVIDINSATGEPLTEPQINHFFDNEWKSLQSKISELQKATTTTPLSRPRTQDDMLDELITRVRSIESALQRLASSVSFTQVAPLLGTLSNPVAQISTTLSKDTIEALRHITAASTLTDKAVAALGAAIHAPVYAAGTLTDKAAAALGANFTNLTTTKTVQELLDKDAHKKP